MEHRRKSAFQLGDSFVFAITDPGFQPGGGAFNNSVPTRRAREIIIELARELPLILGGMIEDQFNVPTLLRARNVILRHLADGYFFDRLVEAYPEGHFTDPSDVVARRMKVDARRKIKRNDAFLAEYLKQPLKERTVKQGIAYMQGTTIGPVIDRVVDSYGRREKYPLDTAIGEDPWDFIQHILYK